MSEPLQYSNTTYLILSTIFPAVTGKREAGRGEEGVEREGREGRCGGKKKRGGEDCS